MKRVRKLLALALALVMLLGLTPAAALAEDGHTHDWRERGRTEPTCTKEGSVTYVCSCGETKTEILPALGHDWDEGKIVDHESSPGGKALRFRCKRCDAIIFRDLPADESDDYGWEPPEEPEEPEIPDGAVSPASGEPAGEAKIGFEVDHIWHWNEDHEVGGKINIYGFLHNLGDVSLFGAVLDLYRWDKSAGAFVFYETVTVDNKGEGYSLWANHYNYARINYDYTIDEWDLENAEDGLAKLQLVARAETEDGQKVESEPMIYSFPIYDPSLLLEAEDCSEIQAPVDGYVKVKITVTSTGTETYAYDSLSSCGWDSEGYYYFGNDELHDYDLSHLQPGKPEKAEFWIEVTADDVAAGEVRRDLCLRFERWSREDGRTVFPDTPMEEQGLGFVWWGAVAYTNWVEIVIPLPEKYEAAPAPAPLTSCQPALTGLGDGKAEWTLTRCGEHAALAREAEGKTSEEALLLWAEALDAEYEEWLAEADEAQRPLIEAERAAFQEHFAACAVAWELLGGKETAARMGLELVMHKVSLLCFAREAGSEDWAAIFAGAEELDAADPEQATCWRQSHEFGLRLEVRESLCPEHAQIDTSAEDEEGWRERKTLWLAALNAETDARWLSADEESRELIAAERQSFGRWLAAWETLLTARYPGDPALVQELLARAVRDRALAFCR
ncbi:MAG: hypothetical protein IJK63_06060 [Oscillospiraceae bacterium]|nr:hypothetical protein [Oscillospiraceae bacterium]